MALFIFPMVEGSLGENTKNSYIGRFEDVMANLTPTVLENAGLEIGDNLLVTDSTGLSRFSQIITGFALDPYETAAGQTDLGYIAAPAQGTVTCDTGTDAILPVVDVTDAGLMIPADKIRLDELESTDTPTFAGITLISTTSSITLNSMTTGQRDALGAQNGRLIYNTTTNELNIFENGIWVAKGGATNLGYTASATDGTVTCDTGTDATLPLVTPTAGSNEAGLMIPADKTRMDQLGSTDTPTFGGIIASGATSTVRVNSMTTVQRDALTPVNGDIIYDTTSNLFNVYQNGSWTPLDSTSTNLAYVAAALEGTVTSSTGTDATLPVVTPVGGSNEAGLMIPADKTRIDELGAADNVVFSGIQSSTNTASLIVPFMTEAQRDALPAPQSIVGAIIYNLDIANFNFSNGGGWVTPGTDIGYIATPLGGEITSSSGTDAAVPLATTVDAGLVAPADKTRIDQLGSTDTPTFGGVIASGTTATIRVNSMTTAQRDALTPVNGDIIYNTTTGQFNLRESGAWSVVVQSDTNLGYTASATDGTVTSSTGTDATLPAATAVDAGLLLPADKTRIDELGSTDTPTFGGIIASGTTSTVRVNSMTTVQRDALTPVNGDIIYNTTTNLFNVYENGAWTPLDSTGTDLSYTAAAGDGTVTSSTGTDATLLAATALDAGLLLPAGFTRLGELESTDTPTFGGLIATGTTSTVRVNSMTTLERDALTPVNGDIIYNSDTGDFNLRESGAWVALDNTPTDLGYTASATDGTVTSSTGTDATLPAVTVLDAGLMIPADKSRLDDLGSTDTPTFAGIVATGTTSTVRVNNLTTVQRDALTPVNGDIIYNTTTGQFNLREGGAWIVVVQAATNLGYTAAATEGTVTSSTGTDATLPAATALDAGLLLPAGFSRLGELESTDTPTFAGIDVLSTTSSLTVNSMTTTQRDLLGAQVGRIIYNTTTNAFNFYENGFWVTK